MRRTAGAVLASTMLLVVPTRAAPAVADTPSSWVVGAAGLAAARSAGPPQAPLGVSAGCVVPAGRILISWQAVAGADSYVVTQTFSQSGSTQSSGATGTSILTNLMLAGAYSFTVRSRSGPNWVGPASSPVTVTLTSSLLCS